MVNACVVRIKSIHMRRLHGYVYQNYAHGIHNMAIGRTYVDQ